MAWRLNYAAIHAAKVSPCLSLSFAQGKESYYDYHSQYEYHCKLVKGYCANIKGNNVRKLGEYEYWGSSGVYVARSKTGVSIVFKNFARYFSNIQRFL